MLARVADNLYWMARAIERADTLARLLEVSHAMTREGGEISDDPRAVWEPVVRITGDLERFRVAHDEADEANAVRFIATSADNPNSVTSCLARARVNAQSVRDLLPTEVWEVLNTLHLELLPGGAHVPERGDVYQFSRLVRRGVALLHGLVDAGMRRDGSWYFLRLGRFVERAEKSARLLEVRYRIPVQAAAVGADLDHWRGLLRSADADEASRRLALDPGSPGHLATLLVTDERFPRSVVYCLDQVAWALGGLVDGGDVTGVEAALSLVARTRAELMSSAPIPADSIADRMNHVQRQCNAIDRAIAASCFAHSPGAGSEGGRQRAQAARQAQN